MTTNPDIEATENASFRSPLMMNAYDTALVIIDVQEKLVPHIRNHDDVVWNIQRLIEGAGILNVKTICTEQYPQGLGHTVSDLRDLLPTESPVSEKTMFSCRECEPVFQPLVNQGVRKLLLTGIETHVCVAQTAMDFVATGFEVYLAVDAVGSRFDIDHATAIKRLESMGVTLTTTEAALFEWCEKAASAEFKLISKLVQKSR